MTLRQLHQTQCVKMRRQFLRLLNSNTSLMPLHINNLCLTILTRRGRYPFAVVTVRKFQIEFLRNDELLSVRPQKLAVA